MFDARIVKLIFGLVGLLAALLVVPLLFLRGPMETGVGRASQSVAASYRDQARLAQAMAMATPFKLAVDSYFFDRGEMPDTANDLGLADYEPYQDDALRSVVVETDGVLRLSMQLGNGARGVVRLIPVYHESSFSIRWQCRSWGLPVMKKVLSDCQEQDL